MSFSQKLINVQIQSAPNSGTGQPNTFTESGTNTVTLSGSRTSVRIFNAGAPSGARASVRIYGLTNSLMNQLSTLGIAWLQLRAAHALRAAEGRCASFYRDWWIIVEGRQ
jgi:hypothetical protein